MCEENPIIGIDLGTTYSRAAIIKDGEANIINGDDGCQKIASYVFFTRSGERIVGNAGKYGNSSENPRRTIYGVKNFIGRSYEEYKQQEKKKSFHYRVENNNDRPIISVQYEGETKYFTPEEISAMVLAKIKERAEEVLGKTVTRAVITVPAHFNAVQRQATEDAGRIAGLEVLKVIDESCAAVMAYGLHNKYKNSRCNILIYDFGRSSFDASVVTIDGGAIDLKATNREACLGGNDIDKRLAQHLINDLKENHNKDLSWDVFAVKRIQQKCKRAKHALSSCLNVNIEIDCLYQEQDLFTKISRTEFEKINSDLFSRTIKCVEKTLEDAKLSKNDITEIVLTGGSSRIPRVREMLQKFFNNKQLNASLNPVEAVAIGAARQAALLNDSKTELFLLNDVCSLDVGIETKGGTMSIMIPRNTKLPAQHTKRYQTSFDDQSEIELSIYEGEQEMVTGNRLLGKFTLPGLKSAPLGHVKFDVHFAINTDGILNVSAQEIGGHNQINLTLQSNRGYYTDIQGMVDQGGRFQEDKSNRAIVECNGSFQ